uniref:Uncharacterized protein n=1 Tax=Rhizophora mucronata TaxID=61149 RepID=A0A2P2R1G0_RHIMU
MEQCGISQLRTTSSGLNRRKLFAWQFWGLLDQLFPSLVTISSRISTSYMTQKILGWDMHQ